jgi:hypothetical protein
VDYARLESAIRNRAHEDVVEMVNRYALSQIAAGQSEVLAVRHPLGFACLPFYRVEQFGACVHVWPNKWQASKLTTSPYHCHSWHLLSYILYGSVGNQLVEVSEGTQYKAFAVTGENGTDHIVATGARMDIRVSEPDFCEAGDFYELAAGLFHASAMRDDGRPAATLVLGSHYPDRLDVTLGEPHIENHEVTREKFDAAQTAAIAELAMLELRQTVSPTPANVGG